MADAGALLWICAKGFQSENDLKSYFEDMGEVKTCVFPLPQYLNDKRGLVGLRNAKGVDKIQNKLTRNKKDAEILNEPFDTVEATVIPSHVTNLSARILCSLTSECSLRKGKGPTRDSFTVEGHYLLVEAFQHKVREALRRAPGAASISGSTRTQLTPRRSPDRSFSPDNSSRRSDSRNSDSHVETVHSVSSGNDKPSPGPSRRITRQQSGDDAGTVKSPAGASRVVPSSSPSQPPRQKQPSPGLNKGPSNQKRASPSQSEGTAGGRGGASQGGGKGANARGRGHAAGPGNSNRSSGHTMPEDQASGRQQATGRGGSSGHERQAQTGTSDRGKGDSSSSRKTPVARPSASGACGGAGDSHMHVFKGSGSGKLKLCIHATNILDIEVDAIVCPVSNTLVHDGGIAKSLMKAGGPDYETKLEKVKKDLTGGMLSENKCKKFQVPRSCDLPFSKVILVNGPTRKKLGGDKKSRLKKSTENILQEASSLTSVAIPLIGSGATGMSARDAAKFMLEAMQIKGKDTAGLREIHFVHPEAAVVDEMVLAANALDMKAWSSPSSSSGGKSRRK